MKRKLYTLSHDLGLLKQLHNDDGRFTAEEHSFLTEHELGHSAFQSRDALLRVFLSTEFRKLASLPYLVELARDARHRRIVSLGAGHCVLEYLLALALPEVEVLATDFDAFAIGKAREFFPEITTDTFDFFKDSPQKLGRPEMAVFFGSAYVLDDAQFVALFGGLRTLGVRRLVDFHAGFMSAKRYLRYLLEPLLPRPTGYTGKLHGFTRSRGELRRLYRNSGWTVRHERSDAAYRYVAELT